MAKTKRIVEREYADGSYCYYMDGRTGKMMRQDNGPRRTRMGQEYCDQYSTNDKTTHPYSYSPFFHWKKDWQKTDTCAYDDRMREWKYDLWNEVCAELPAATQFGQRQFQYQTPETLSKMLSKYCGEPVTCTALVEGCNVSNGYPYYVFYWRANTPKLKNG